nr:MAG TPA: hypothetical protein [Caudoviricetes sp.]
MYIEICVLVVPCFTSERSSKELRETQLHHNVPVYRLLVRS